MHIGILAKTVAAMVLIFAVFFACEDESNSSNNEGALRNRQFLLRESEGFEPVEGTVVRIGFTETELDFSAGCNHYSGNYEIDGSAFVVDGMGSTEMGCEADLHAQDEWLAEFFTSKPTFVLHGNNLTFTFEDATLQFLDREVADPDRPLVGSLWTVDTFIEGGGASNLPMQDSPTLLFSDDGSLSVNTTCNTSTGRYAVAGEELILSEMAYTEVACSGASAIVDEKVQAVIRDGTLSFEIEAARLTLMRGDLGLGAMAP